MSLLKSDPDISTLNCYHAWTGSPVKSWSVSWFICMYKGGPKTGPSTATFNNVLCLIWFIYMSYNKCVLVYVLPVSTNIQYKKWNEVGLMRCNVPVVQFADSSWHVTVHWSPLKRPVWNTDYEELWWWMHVRPANKYFTFFIIKFDPGIKTCYGKNRLEKFCLLMYFSHRQFWVYFISWRRGFGTETAKS
jgi:hypothetical protein